ncbi:hypothetical protein TNCV_1788241 [Trichonephila clavipes]|nr:hypothetical protein TNCV_1788241 [Trichonephila clavipes]
MWFQLARTASVPPVQVLIGVDGHLYFRLYDLLQLLQIKNVSKHFHVFSYNHILPLCGNAIDIAWIRFRSLCQCPISTTEADSLQTKQGFPYFNRGKVVTPDALRAFILRGFKHFPSLKMKYNATKVSIGSMVLDSSRNCSSRVEIGGISATETVATRRQKNRY